MIPQDSQAVHRQPPSGTGQQAATRAAPTGVATSPVKQGYVPELDGVRGIAILAVMSLHFIAAQVHVAHNGIERLAGEVTGYGMWGVDLFFVLSGYLITGLLADSRESHNFFSSFYIRRTLRIFPLYYGVIFILVALIPRGLLEAHAPDALEIRAVQPWLWSYLTNVYIAKQGSYAIPYVSHFWTLSIEEHFYLLWPLIIWLVSRRTAIFVAIALSLCALASRIVLAFTTSDDLWAHVFTPCRLDTLCIGSAFALWVRGPEGWAVLRRAVIGLPFVLGAMLALRVFGSQGVSHQIALNIKEFLLAVLCGVFVSTAAWPSGWRPMRAALRWRPLKLMGRYSYGLYVFHGIIAYYLGAHLGASYFAPFVGSHTGGLFLQALVGSLLSVLIAVVSYHAYELPFLRLKRRFAA